MKNKTKKLFFTYIGVSVLAIITPIAIICGTSYHTNKIANSKQINTTKRSEYYHCRLRQGCKAEHCAKYGYHRYKQTN